MSEVVVASGLTVVRDGRTILDVEALTIDEGQRWALLGPNGSGKTTLLNVIAGRLWPTSGDVWLLGHQLGHVDLRTLRGRLGLLSASVSKSLRPSLRAHDVVVTGLDGALEPWWREYAADDHQRADALLEEVGAGDLRDRPIGVVSEGERAQILLARTMMADPDLLCLDEPAAGLDLGARERLVTRLGRLMASDSPAPVVMVTHHLEELPAGLTHAAVLRAGLVLASGPVEEVVTSSTISDAFGVAIEVTPHDDGRFSARGTAS